MYDQHMRPGSVDDSAYGGLVDAGSTPLLFPPMYYQEESSLRSTLPQCDQPVKRADSVVAHPETHETKYSTPRRNRKVATSEGAHVQAEAEEGLLTPRYTTTFTPINKPPYFNVQNSVEPKSSAPRVLPTNSSSFAKRYRRHLPELRLDFTELEENELPQLDRDEDRVYHFNHEKGGAYSGTFIKSTPVPGEYKSWIEKTLANKNKALRAEDGRRQERRIRSLLQQQGSMLLEKTQCLANVGHELFCSLRGCLSNTTCIPPDTYCLVTRASSPDQIDNNEQVCYCLRCFEWVWKGSREDMEAPMVHPDIMRGGRVQPDNLISPSRLGPTQPVSYLSEVAEDTAETMRLDEDSHMIDCADSDHFQATTPKSSRSFEPCSPALIDTCLDTMETTSANAADSSCSSRPDQYNAAPTVDDSPRSTNSSGEWLHPPTRLQHIASSIIPSVTVASKEEKATVWLWKAASQAQLQWEQHLRRYRQTQAFYDGRSDDDGRMLVPEFKIEETEYSGEEVEVWENLCGLKKDDCYGCDLSEVLYKSKQRQQSD